MIVLAIILLILLLILLLPVGADASYIDGSFALKAKVGPLRFGIIPGKEKDAGEKREKKSKPKKEKKPHKDVGAEGRKKIKGKPKLNFDDIMTIIRIGLKALGRFRRSISVDELMLHFVSGGTDPYSAVMNYGYFNAAIGALQPLLHKAFKIKHEDYASSMDFGEDKLKIDGRIVLTVRIGEILLLILCAAFAFLKWFLSFRRRTKQQSKEKNEISEDSSVKKGN